MSRDLRGVGCATPSFLVTASDKRHLWHKQHGRLQLYDHLTDRRESTRTMKFPLRAAAPTRVPFGIQSVSKVNMVDSGSVLRTIAREDVLSPASARGIRMINFVTHDP